MSGIAVIGLAATEEGLLVCEVNIMEIAVIPGELPERNMPLHPLEIS
jgi:hypothetical protein